MEVGPVSADGTAAMAGWRVAHEGGSFLGDRAEVLDTLVICSLLGTVVDPSRRHRGACGV